MSDTDLLARLQAEGADIPPELDNGGIDRIITEPEQQALSEAIAADAVDAVPIVGDLLAITRLAKAEEQGIDYPSRPNALENALSDLPPPVDTIGDILVSQNVISYLNRKYDLQITDIPGQATDELSNEVDQAVNRLPGN